MRILNVSSFSKTSSSVVCTLIVFRVSPGAKVIDQEFGATGVKSDAPAVPSTVW